MSGSPHTVFLRIEALGEHGEGVAQDEGLPLYVEGALPGEEVEVALDPPKATYRTGQLLRVLEASPHRQRAPCSFFPECGGCQIQHLNMEGQLRFKRDRVVRALKSYGLHADVAPVRPSAQNWSYRCKMLMPVEGLKLGLYAADSHRLVPLSHCLVHCTAGEAARQAVQDWLLAEGPFCSLKHVLMRTSHATGQVLIALVVGSDRAEPWERHAAQIAARCPAIAGVVLNTQPATANTVLGRETRPLWGSPRIEERLFDIPIELSATSFFQVNPPQAEAIGHELLAWASQRPNSRLLDAYCGAGALALALARQGHRVTGLELVPSAIEDATRTACSLGLEAEFICGRAEEWLDQDPRSWEGLILNPPRKGCGPRVMERVLEKRPARICMVCCEPRAMARDLQQLAAGYVIERVQPYDLFPQTAHVETLVTLLSKPTDSI